jgi:hypothetical protein
MPSRLRSATVIPETGLSVTADSETHTPQRLCRVPPPLKHVIRALRFAGERLTIGARGSVGVSSAPGPRITGSPWKAGSLVFA